MYYITFLILMLSEVHAEVSYKNSDTDVNDLSARKYAMKIKKCCEDDEIMVDRSCQLYSKYNQSEWVPKFKAEDGKNIDMKRYVYAKDVSPKTENTPDEDIIYYEYIIGVPDCENTEVRAIFDLGKSEDELNLLPNGMLRHIIHHEHSTDTIKEDPLITSSFSLHGPIPIPEVKEPITHSHDPNKFCIDKIYMSATNITGEYAQVCIPEVKNWKDIDFIMKKVINPLFHALAMVLFLLVAIIYFVLPTLRDLAGNIITTINVCLIVSQAADLVRIFTEFSNHVSFMITDIILYISLLGAFFWLNSFGFYVWKTFKSRNVFLRVTDVRKYCYYSSVVWSSVVMMAALAICAHFLLDTGTNPGRKMRTQFSSSILIDDVEQETIGWLGIAIFFTPVTFTIVFNIFFYVTTLRVIKSINIYGRIHHKLKGCFDLFLQLFLIMTTAWLFLLLSWLNFDGLIYAHIVVNALQAILVFYVCVVRQSHVIFLLRKSCCYAEPVPTGEWGDEMTQYM